MADAPLWARDGLDMHLIWVSGEEKYFCKWGLTRFRKIRNDLPAEAGQELDIFWSLCTIRFMTKHAFKTSESPNQAGRVPSEVEEYVGPVHPVQVILLHVY